MTELEDDAEEWLSCDNVEEDSEEEWILLSFLF